MKSFLRKTGMKITCYILCAVLLTAAALSGAGVLVLLYTGEYEASGRLYTEKARQHMWQNMESIMDGYFDPSDPEHPWASYYADGIYSGRNSNFVYTITDNETGKTVLSTYDGDAAVSITLKDSHSYERYDEVEIEEPYEVEGDIFSCADSVFRYDTSTGGYSELEGELAAYLTEVPEVPGDVYVMGFSHDGMHYDYDEYESGFFATGGSSQVQITQQTYTITGYLLAGLPHQDAYRSLSDLCTLLTACRYDLIAVMAVSGVLGLVLLILLCCHVGRFPDREGPELSAPFRVPMDVGGLLFIILLAACGDVTPGFSLARNLAYSLTVDGIVCLAVTAASIYLLLLLCAQAKTRTVISGSLIYWCLTHMGKFFRWLGRGLGKILGLLPMIWKVLAIYGAVSLLELILMAMWSVDGESVFLWLLERIFGGAVIAYVTLAFRRLKTGAEAIAAGDYNTKVSERHLVLDFKDTADTLNHIQDGMTTAVESRMKSERLKTELITNVSHDLKTPLTSIVSYVDLLKQELQQAETVSRAAEEYIDVLDRQSLRLKKLIEDLVEASKASTGNLTLQLEPLDFTLLLNQALGEYTPRLSEAGLTLIQRLPEEPVMVRADGRRLWRVFDNLLGNAVKYAMPGTRLYLNVDTGDQVTATFRNITREPLEVSAQELTERFVRGDASRHTEGSGLGLSIAQSLTESMGGHLQVDVDGDLFKVMVTLPVLAALPAPEASDS